MASYDASNCVKPRLFLFAKGNLAILKRFCCSLSNFRFDWTVKLGEVCCHLADIRVGSLGLFSSDDVASKPRLYD